MAGFGSLNPAELDPEAVTAQPEETWQDREAQAALEALKLNKPPARSWYDTINDVAHFPHRMFGQLTSPRPDDPARMMPENYVYRTINNTADALAGAIKSGVTAPGDALTGELPMTDAEGHTSPEAISRGFDLASIAGGGSVAGTAGQAARSAGTDFRVLGRKIGGEADPASAIKITPVSELAAPYHAALEGGTTLASDSAKPGAVIAAAEHAPPFTTAAEPALERIGRKVGTAEQWKNDLAKYGVTKEEMKYRGFDELKPGQPLSREQLAAHLENSPVEIKPVVHATPQWEQLSPQRQHDIADNWRDAFVHEYESPRDLYEAMVADGEERGSAQYREYQLPGGENYRERLLTLPDRSEAQLLREEAQRRGYGDRIRDWPDQEFAQQYRDKVTNAPSNPGIYKSVHWEEPNVIVHRRSTDREMPVPFTPEEQVAADAHAAASAKLEDLRQRQGLIAKSINTIVKPLEKARQDQIRADVKAGKISWTEALPQLETVVEHPEIKTLQNTLQDARAQEDAIRKSLPPEPQQKTIKTLHDEEQQSDWHQAGAKVGYGKYDQSQGALLPKDQPVPDGPFKDSWHRLALHDQIREAAEKGFDRISWTGGKSSPTNPKNLGRTGEEAEKAERGLIKHYDEKLVNAANKIGKAHGVQVEKSSIPDAESMSGEKAMARMGVDRSEWERMAGTDGFYEWRDKLFKDATAKGHDIYHMDIPQSLKDQALQKGFSLFEDSGRAGGVIAAAEHAKPYHDLLDQPRGLSFPAEEAADRLRMKLAREEKAAAKGVEVPGAPANPRTVIRAPKGSDLPDFVAGKITPEDWIKRHETMLSPQEIQKSAKWYDEIRGEFLKHTNGDEKLAAKYMRAWLVSQQNVDVSGAMANTLLQREQILRGVPEAEMKAGGMPNPTLAARRVLQDQPVAGVGQKIADFVDAAEGKDVRSWMGNDARGGKPFVVDVHTARDTGMVDPELVNHLTRLGYNKKDLAKLKTDLGTSPSQPQYENRATFGQGLTDHLNKIKWQGRDDWTPREVQAVGWMGMTRLTANKADDVVTGLQNNMRHLSMELAPGEGSPWAAKYGDRFGNLAPEKRRELTHQISQQAIELASKVAGVDVRDIVHGTGGWQTFQNPSTVAQTFSSKQGAEIAANVLGHLLQQTEVWSNKVKPLTSNPKGFAVDLIADGEHGLRTDAGLRDFWSKIMAADPTGAGKSPLFQGYQPIKMPDGRVGIRVLIDRGGEGTKNALESALGPIKSMLEKEKGDFEIRRHEAEIYKARNDWTEHPNGQSYRQRLVDLIGRDRATELDRLGPQLEGVFRRAIEAAEAPAAKKVKKTTTSFGSLAPGAE